MPMTPQEIGSKTFGKGMRGYQCGEVNKFLELLSQEFEAVYTANYDLREKTKLLEAEISHYHKLEDTLQQTLVLAQQTSEEVKSAAQREAELILQEAELDKARKVAEAKVVMDGLKEEIEGLSRRKNLLKTQLRSFLTAHLDLEKLQERDDDLDVI